MTDQSGRESVTTGRLGGLCRSTLPFLDQNLGYARVTTVTVIYQINNKVR